MTVGESKLGVGDAASLAAFLTRHPKLFVLTGAGCSTDSGIPDYRDGAGQWKRPQPMDYREFIASDSARKRYWARSMIGWPSFERARPNRGHDALARLERHGFAHWLVTQNVDRLHQRAGSRCVIDLHGRLDRVSCLECGGAQRRDQFQSELLASNLAFAELDAHRAPDGDADLEGTDFATFRVPACTRCGGTLKPDVVFYGESVPRSRVDDSFDALERSDAMLIVGSSLMVFSGFRFARRAAELGKPIAAVNLGRTRADELIGLKVVGRCAEILPAAVKRMLE